MYRSPAGFVSKFGNGPTQRFQGENPKLPLVNECSMDNTETLAVRAADLQERNKCSIRVDVR